MESDTEIFLKSVKAICPTISDVELALFASKITFEELKRKEIFLQSGTIQKSIGYITDGLIRSFYVDENGNEITVGFYSEGDYATDYPSFLYCQPSQYTIQCLEPTKFVCFTHENQQWLYQQSPIFERYGRIIAEKVLKTQQSRIESFIFQTAEDRYLHFTKNHPSLFNRISLSHLCSFLGIERQSLTRIRHKLAHQ